MVSTIHTTHVTLLYLPPKPSTSSRAPEKEIGYISYLLLSRLLLGMNQLTRLSYRLLSHSRAANQLETFSKSQDQGTSLQSYLPCNRWLTFALPPGSPPLSWI
jgi:hypothetical protein